jgi:hypothetical protein
MAAVVKQRTLAFIGGAQLPVSSPRCHHATDEYSWPSAPDFGGMAVVGSSLGGFMQWHWRARLSR